MLGKYSTNVLLPKNKSDVAKAINGLGQVDIKIWEPIDKHNIQKIHAESKKCMLSSDKPHTLILITHKYD